MCGAFCKPVHLMRSTPASLAFDPFTAFNAEVRECFVFSFVLDLTDSAWQQTQLSLKYGGLGLHVYDLLHSTLLQPILPQFVPLVCIDADNEVHYIKLGTMMMVSLLELNK